MSEDGDGPPIADEEAAIRGAIYGLLATLFEEPDTDTVPDLKSGDIGDQFASLVAMSDLDVAVPDLVPEDDETLLKARFNDLFAVGYPEPPVPRYESAYYNEGQWESINVDLSRAYDYFGVSVDQTEREHHDHLLLELEFAGYLSRLAAIDGEPSVRRARRDFLDRHLLGLADGMVETIREEVETGIYEDLVGFLAEFVEADLEALEASVGESDRDETEGPSEHDEPEGGRDRDETAAGTEEPTS